MWGAGPETLHDKGFSLFYYQLHPVSCTDALVQHCCRNPGLMRTPDRVFHVYGVSLIEDHLSGATVTCRPGGGTVMAWPAHLWPAVESTTWTGSTAHSWPAGRYHEQGNHTKLCLLPHVTFNNSFSLEINHLKKRKSCFPFHIRIDVYPSLTNCIDSEADSLRQLVWP